MWNIIDFLACFQYFFFILLESIQDCYCYSICTSIFLFLLDAIDVVVAAFSCCCCCCCCYCCSCCSSSCILSHIFPTSFHVFFLCRISSICSGFLSFSFSSSLYPLILFFFFFFFCLPIFPFTP